MDTSPEEPTQSNPESAEPETPAGGSDEHSTAPGPHGLGPLEGEAAEFDDPPLVPLEPEPDPDDQDE